ncbi:MAG: bifunctional phosphopantothenoylcysteine decarboxylase/phosphopantothenate--cysteine ligase CoaBC [Candidatus Aminicenantes bacterium]|nr:bifunctional phosphopantothenoylcysteine decarboxylase/phosphopantothenate--cysteine ligase CoaBC [Candidatus Aminicenantes bacterium]
MTKIALGVSSSISIYKACEIVRRFQEKKFKVQVIMTKNATQFISPLLFSALSGQEVVVDPFEKALSKTIAHVSLAQEISLLCVAPATANIIGKFSSGVADDFLSTFFQTVKCPVLIAPAMNEAMYFHHPTQTNIQRLKAMGVKFVEPEEGYLACQEEGWGRLAAPEKIVEEGLKLIKISKSLKGKSVLITAGPTREYLDPVRFVSNRSSGKMGYELAAEGLSRGAEVILVSGPTQIMPPVDAELRKVQTAEEMEKEVQACFPRVDVVIMAAAVSDFRFPNVSSQKIKKRELKSVIEFVSTPDILGKLSQKKAGQVLVGFAAETDNILKNAKEKMREKHLDLMVANDVKQRDIGFDSDYNRVSIIDSHGKVLKTEKMSKREISQIIFDKIEGLVGK